MKRGIALLLVVAVALLLTPTFALAFTPPTPAPIHSEQGPSLDAEEYHWNDEIGCAVKVHSALVVDFDKDWLVINCLDPITPGHQMGLDVATWDIKSNLPWYKDVSWCGLIGVDGKNQGMTLPSELRLKDTVGEWVVPPDNVVRYYPGNKTTIPPNWVPGQQNPELFGPDHHLKREFLMLKVDLGENPWCKTAGWYVGNIKVSVHQN